MNGLVVEKVTNILQGTGNKGPGDMYLFYKTENTLDFVFCVFHSVNVLKFVRRLPETFFVEYPTVRTTRCVLSMSTSLYPLVLLVISRMHLIREYHCTDC